MASFNPSELPDINAMIDMLKNFDAEVEEKKESSDSPQIRRFKKTINETRDSVAEFGGLSSEEKAKIVMGKIDKMHTSHSAPTLSAVMPSSSSQDAKSERVANEKIAKRKIIPSPTKNDD